MSQEPNKIEEQPKQLKIGMVLIENPETKDIHFVLVAVNEKNEILKELSLPAKTVFEYLTQFQDKFMPKKDVDKALKSMVV